MRSNPWIYLLIAGLSGCATADRAASAIGTGISNSTTRAGTWVADTVTGANKPESPAELVEFEATFNPSIVWKKRLSDGVGRGYPPLRPAYDGGRLYVVDDDRRTVSAYEMSNRKRLWKRQLDEPISGGLGAGEGLVLSGSATAKVIALRAQDGEPVWSSTVSSEILAAPAIGEGVVVVATGDGKLYGLDATTGEHKWLVEREVPILSLRGASTPVAAGGLALNGFADGHLLAIDLQTGFEAWDTAVALPQGRTELDRIVDADGDLAMDNDVVFAGTYQGRLAAIGLHSGEVLWARQLSSNSDIAADDLNVYLTDPDGVIWALDKTTGATYWKQNALAGRRCTAPVVFGNKVVVGDFDGYVHWLDRDDGKFVARKRLSRDQLIKPWVLDDILLIVDVNGKGTALQPEPEG